MTRPAIVDTSRLSARRGSRATPKGRVADPAALAEVRALLGDAPRRADLLIEHLHRIQDACGCLPAPHLVALAQELKLATTEVYEVATFYHHFDVVKEGEARPPTVTVRVCETLSCRMAGAPALLSALERLGLKDVRVAGVPCVGRCDRAPVAVVGRNPVDHASVESVASAVRERRTEAPPAQAVDLDAYLRGGGYRTLVDCTTGKRTAESAIAELESSSLRGLGGAGFPAGRKWKIVRAEPAPRLMAVNIDEGEPGS